MGSRSKSDVSHGDSPGKIFIGGLPKDTANGSLKPKGEGFSQVEGISSAFSEYIHRAYEKMESSLDEETTLTPTENDLVSDEAVWDLYERWCLYHKLLRNFGQMQKRFNIFKMNASYAYKMNQKDSSSHFPLSEFCDKIELHVSSGVEEMTLTPTAGDMETDEALWCLYHRWCCHHKIRRTPKEMELASSSFKKSATHAFVMSQKDPTVRFCLSIWCDETDRPVDEVTLIPTKRATIYSTELCDLYFRYCLYYNMRRPLQEILQHRIKYFSISVTYVYDMNARQPTRFFLSSRSDEKDMHGRSARSISIRPTFKDLGSDHAVWILYQNWCLFYKIDRTSVEINTRFNIFMKNAHHVFEMNELDTKPFCQFHLPTTCDEKDLFDPSGDEGVTLTPTKKDLESDEAVWDLYYRWCLYHQILRTHEEMQYRFSIFKMNASYANKMNQKDPSSHFPLSEFSDKIELRVASGVKEMTLTPTAGDMETDEALWYLYHRWCGHHKICRTPKEMELAFSSFKKSAFHAFVLNQKDPHVWFCLSAWCDETDIITNDVRLIPTKRDLKSGNALLGLYHRYCRAYMEYRTPYEMQQRFCNFKKSVNHVFEKNKTGPSPQFFLSDCCDEKEMLDRAAYPVSIIPTFRDLVSNEAVWALYCRWCRHHICRTTEEMCQRFNHFKGKAYAVFNLNNECPGFQCLSRVSDGDSFYGVGPGPYSGIV